MSEIRVRVTNGSDVVSDLVRAGDRVVAQTKATVRYYGQLLQTKVKANANTGTHRPGAPHIPGTGPGPNVATGDYNRSIGLELQLSDDGWSRAAVGTNKVQGRRLELGFVGADSAGRHVNSPPYPHFGPAHDEIAPQFETAVARIGATGGM